MSIWKEIQAIPSTNKQLREFGLLVGGVLLAIGAWGAFKEKPHAVYFIVPGALLFFSGLVFPPVLKPPQKVWMALAVVLGFVMSRVILTLLYFLVITPIGLYLRLTGKDLLEIRGPARESYWQKRKPRPKEDYEKQF